MMSFLQETVSMLTFIIHSLSRLLRLIIYMLRETAGRNFCRFFSVRLVAHVYNG